MAGSAAARAEAGKPEKYVDLVRAAGAARFDAACAEDFEAFGKGALVVLQWIAEVEVVEEGRVAERKLLKWKVAQHMGLYVARSVVEEALNITEYLFRPILHTN
jgi:hypothetical protein